VAKIKLYIACSLDGYIARRDGSLDWLDSVDHPEGVDYGYGDFYSGIDTVVMGRKTYDEVLGFDVDWPYPDCRTYVVTSDSNFKAKTENTHVLTEINRHILQELRKASLKNIWLVGGGELIKSFLEIGAIDEMVISVFPAVLGSGIPLFPEGSEETQFTLNGAHTFDSGVVNLYYVKK